jgi:alkylhydroperoxidase family enzyme
MPTRFDPEQVDLAETTERLRALCGSVVQGAIVGRTLLRDAVVEELRCSELEAEALIDTLIARGFVVRRESIGDAVEWTVGS